MPRRESEQPISARLDGQENPFPTEIAAFVASAANLAFASDAAQQEDF